MTATPNLPKQLTPAERLVFPLNADHESRDAELVERLRPTGLTFMVGQEVILRGGMRLARQIIREGRVIGDLKWGGDNRATTEQALAYLVKDIAITVPFITVHDCVASVVQALRNLNSPTGVLRVTAMVDKNPAAALGGQARLRRQVVEIARQAMLQGAAGIVCPANELRVVRAAIGSEAVILCSGVRPIWAPEPIAGQPRVATVTEAIEAGATYVVVGRSIRHDPEPAKAARRVIDEIAKAT